MMFVIGGTCQGKRAFVGSFLVPEMKGRELPWTDGAFADWNQFMKGSFCVNFHLFVRRLMNGEISGNGELAEKLVSTLMRENPDRILVTDEIGYGIVPLDAFERQYREETGRICCQAARNAEQVWRVCCGMGQRIK